MTDDMVSSDEHCDDNMTGLTVSINPSVSDDNTSGSAVGSSPILSKYFEMERRFCHKVYGLSNVTFYYVLHLHL